MRDSKNDGFPAVDSPDACMCSIHGDLLMRLDGSSVPSVGVVGSGSLSVSSCGLGG